MTPPVEVHIRAVDMRRMMRDDLTAVARAATTSVRRATLGSRRDIQKQLRRSLTLGRRLSGGSMDQLVRAWVEPRRGNRLDPKGRVYSRARYRRPSGTVDLLLVFDEGALITGRGGKWLAIPTGNAPLKSGRGGARRATPGEAGLNLVFLPAGSNRGVLVDPGSREVLYVLVKQVRVRKRIDLDRVFQARSARLVDQFFRTLAREDEKLEAKYRSVRER